MYINKYFLFKVMRTKKKQCGDKIYYEICECGLKTIHLLLYKLFVLGDIM